MINIFKKKEDNKQNVRKLLHENLNLYPIDMFFIDDPIMSLNKEERLLYLKFFADLYTDKKLTDRIKFYINRQAQQTLGNSKDGIEDLAGAMNINGLAIVIEDISKLANMYIKESTKPEEDPIDKFSVIPRIG